MIFKRAVARLRAQDWLAIVIEIGIVVIGVFIRTQVSNWNAARLEKVEARKMLVQLGPNLQIMAEFFDVARDYYGATREYAAIALAGWRGDPSVGDADFVKAAYQASQILAFGTNSSAWASVLGADRLRSIDDPAVRNDLSYLMSADYGQLDLAAVDTPYRRNVRRIIPIDLQDAIRERCGDRPGSADAAFFFPATDVRFAGGSWHRQSSVSEVASAPRTRRRLAVAYGRASCLAREHDAVRKKHRPTPEGNQPIARIAVHRNAETGQTALMTDDHLYRRGVGVMLINEAGRVWVGRRIDNTDEAWQMPQGGMDEGEMPLDTAFRELEEETGIAPNLVEQVAAHPQRLRYDLPPELAGRLWKGKWKGQDQDWFLMRFTGSDADVNIATEDPEFNDWKWVDPAHLPDLIVPFKRDMYRAIVAGFGEWLDE